MPIYEYRCSRCDDIFEIFHKIDEDCKVACPKCLAPAKKLISAPNFILKGAGFYVTDYRKEKPPTESKSECKAECKTECKSEKAGTCNSAACHNSKN